MSFIVFPQGCRLSVCSQRSRKAYPSELSQFHTRKYIQFLERLTPEPNEQMKTLFAKYGIGDDCPPFEGLFDFCAMYAGASIDGARRINNGQCDIAINWAGGLHHAKQREASGRPPWHTFHGFSCRDIVMEVVRANSPSA
jgi:acetoin utilization deacetylase AcuC-like enzyme